LGFDFNAIWKTLLLLSFLVVVHELGHFITARMFGVKVHEFSVGFGPLIGKFTRKGVQYSFRWVLLGGFCKIAGMDMAVEGEPEEPPVDPKESFNYLSLWKKVVVIGAGPVFNLILAMVLIFVMAAFIGLPTSLKSPAPIIEQASLGSPAFEAGLKSGDKIVAIDGTQVNEWQDIPKLVAKSQGRALKITIERQNQIIEKEITPLYNSIEKRYLIGVSPLVNYERTSISEAIKLAVLNTGNFIWQFYKSFGEIISMAFKGGVMGPIGMVTVIEKSAGLPLYHTFFLLFQISMFLFIFNMLPIPLPLLDGGWIVILLLEKLFRKEFSVEQKAAAQMVGMMAMLVLGVMVTYNDIVRVIRMYF
jgi:regulator of sigma E protease